MLCDRIYFWLEIKECCKICVFCECFYFFKLVDLMFYFFGIKVIYFGVNERKYENFFVMGICYVIFVEI